MSLRNYRPKSIDDLQRMADAIRAKCAASNAVASAAQSAGVQGLERDWKMDRASSFRRAGLTYKEIARRTGLSMSEARAATAGIRDRSVRGHYNVRSRLLKWPFGLGNDDPVVGVINKVVPKNLDEDIRQEVCQELAAMLLAGSVSETDLAAHVENVIRNVKKFNGAGLSMLSLDYAFPGHTTPIKELV